MEQGQEPEASAPVAHERAGGLLRQPRVRLGVVLVVLAVVIAVVWAVIGSSSSSSHAPTPTNTAVGPVGLSASGLRTLGSAVGQPIYWAGSKEGYLYEMTRNLEGDVYIRYLPPGVKVGAKGAHFLVIVTYPFAGAFQALKNVSNGREISIPGGGIALVDEKYPNSVHLAYPGEAFQIEVYDPSPARSLEVARSGAVRPVH